MERGNKEAEKEVEMANKKISLSVIYLIIFETLCLLKFLPK